MKKYNSPLELIKDIIQDQEFNQSDTINFTNYEVKVKLVCKVLRQLEYESIRIFISSNRSLQQSFNNVKLLQSLAFSNEFDKQELSVKVGKSQIPESDSEHIEDLNNRLKALNDLKNFLSDKLSKCERVLKKSLSDNKNLNKTISDNKQKINELHTIIERMKLKEESDALEIKESKEREEFQKRKHKEEIGTIDQGIIQINNELKVSIRSLEKVQIENDTLKDENQKKDYEINKLKEKIMNIQKLFDS